VREWVRKHPAHADGLAAVVLFIVFFLGAYLTFSTGRRSALVVFAGVMSFLPMAWIRRWTTPVSLVVALASSYTAFMGHNNQIGLVWALFVIGWKLKGRALYQTGFATIAITVIQILAEPAVRDRRFEPFSLVAIVAFAVPILLGRMLANSNERTAAAERELGLRIALHQQAVERAGGEERARLARELHDAVAHSMSVVVLHAAGAQAALDDAPSVARASMVTIEQTARESLTEMRRLVTELRIGHPEVAGLSPRAGIDDVAGLIEAHPHSSLEVEGDLTSKGALIDSSVFRIVQESLTNARRHAPGALTKVRIHSTAQTVVIDVRNAVTGRAGNNQPGFGLIGMAERVAAVGGVFRCGPDKWGEWEVHAELPIGRHP
jgi:signal transduction histidine kinase